MGKNEQHLKLEKFSLSNSFRFLKKQARKGFRPISASEVLLVRKVNNLINKKTEHCSCRIFVQQVK